ncbi:MAG: hypothetical protein FJZ92_12515 [Chloroflexi bacterium]|nr:hypothetical protein [Chloroflexota bacterium]
MVAPLVPVVGGLALAALALVWAPPEPARAGTISVDATRVQSKDPTSITFTARVRTSAGLKGATFEYKVLNPDGNIGGSGEAQFSPGNETDVTFMLETKTATRYIPVGSDFVFNWSLTDSDGVSSRTTEETYRFLDGRYLWQTRTEGQITVFWYGNDDRHAMLAIGATKSALDDVSALLRATVPYPVKVVVWRSEAEGELAKRPRGRVFDATVQTGGQRVSPDLLFVFTPNADVIRHEAAHIVTHVAGDGPFSSIPSWLDEGTAVYAQSSPGGGYSSAVQFVIQTDQALRLRQIQSPVNSADLVNVFYGQSWSTVKYMIDKYGRDKFAELFKVAREGARIDDALKRVYGFDQDGLYNEWRQANGLRPQTFQPEPVGTAVAVAEATRVPLGIPTPTKAGSAPGPSPAAPSGGEQVKTTQDGGGGGTAAVAVAVGGASVLVAILLLGAGVFLLRKRT